MSRKEIHELLYNARRSLFARNDRFVMATMTLQSEEPLKHDL
jgi:hypothetical protein